MSAPQITCPLCDALAQRRENGFFCPPCGRVFGGEISKSTPAMPKAFKVAQNPKSFAVTWRWMRKSEWKYFPLVLLFIVAAVVGIFFLWHDDMTPLVKALFTIALVLPSLGGAYDRACVLFNRASLYADKKVVVLSHRPLPGRVSREFDAEEIDQIFCVERPTLKGHVYDVRLLTKDNEGQTLVRDLDTAEQALYLEHALESFLGIQDRAVEGEVAV